MKKIRLLTVTFDTEVKSYEIPAFRAAVIEKTGRANVLFHNHLVGDKFLYKYPLIQYKRIGFRPCIMCLEYGVDEIHKFFENRNWNITIGNRNLQMKLRSLNLNQYTLQVWDKLFTYEIRNWVALNQENFKKFSALKDTEEQTRFLEKTLIGNIMSMAKGVEWNVDKPIAVNITSAPNIRQVRLKGNKLLGFNLAFSTNVFLPNFIGLGKSVSLGYGMVNQKREPGRHQPKVNS